MAKAKLLNWNRPIDVVAAGWALSAAWVALFVLCALFGMLLPRISLVHGWLAIFSSAPLGSGRSFVEGILGSFVFGWIMALVIGLVYNRLAGR